MASGGKLANPMAGAPAFGGKLANPMAGKPASGGGMLTDLNTKPAPSYDSAPVMPTPSRPEGVGVTSLAGPPPDLNGMLTQLRSAVAPPSAMTMLRQSGMDGLAQHAPGVAAAITAGDLRGQVAGAITDARTAIRSHLGGVTAPTGQHPLNPGDSLLGPGPHPILDALRARRRNRTGQS